MKLIKPRNTEKLFFRFIYDRCSIQHGDEQILVLSLRIAMTE